MGTITKRQFMKRCTRTGKMLALTAALTLMISILTACSGNAAVTIDTGALADNLHSQVTWKDQLGEIELDKALSLYGISADAVASGKVYMGTNATAEEIAVLEAASADQVAAVKAGLEARIEAQLTSFQSYNAAEVPKLEDPVLQTKGNYVILCVCDNKTEAENVINESTEK